MLFRSVMAILFELNDEVGWQDWLAERPPAIQEAVRRWPPNRLYRMSDTGHRVTIASYCETDEGIRVLVDVSGDYNLITFPRQVFGIDPATLTECELPAPDEPVGVTMLPDEVEAYLAKMRGERG